MDVAIATKHSKLFLQRFVTYACMHYIDPLVLVA